MSSRVVVQSVLALSTSLVVGAVLAREAAALRQEPPKPGPHQGHLKMDEGTWDAVVKFHAPDGTISESKGVETNAMGSGGWFLISDVKSELLGSPFIGHGFTGYDPGKKKYVAAWGDSMGPQMMFLEGTCDSDGKVRTMFAEFPGPDGKVQKSKQVNESTGKDTRKATMFVMGDDGKFTTMMTIEYKRRK